MRVCQHLRRHVVDTPSLWTHVDHIQDPAALSFVLERAENVPVDITCLIVTGPDDVRFTTLAAHMHHIRTLCLNLNPIGHNYRIEKTNRAFTAFKMTAPLLQRLSMRAERAIGSDSLIQVFSSFTMAASTKPLLSSLQLHGVDLDRDFFRRLPTLREFSFSGCEDTRFLGSRVPEYISQHVHNLATINLELSGWSVTGGSSGFGQSVQQINIRWIRPGLFVPRQAIPDRAGWSSIRAVHVAHMCSSSDVLLTTTSTPTNLAIPETIAPYQNLSVRTSGAPNPRTHMRVIDREERERVFCGLHPTTVADMVAHIPGQDITAITIDTTSILLGIFSSARCPTLNRLRIVLDTNDISWFRVLTQNMLGITTLERLEFGKEAGSSALTWSSAIIMSVLASCVATGNIIRAVVFLGFQPEAQFVASAKMFAQEVVVDRGWREPESDRVWFTEPPFEWF